MVAHTVMIDRRKPFAIILKAMNIKDRLTKAYGSASGSNDAKPPQKQSPAASRIPAKAGMAAKPPAPPPKKPGSKTDAKSFPMDEEALLKGGVKDKGARKVAKFLLLLGSEQAAQVLKHMKNDEIESISREIATIKKIENEEARAILAEFGWLARSGGYFIEGGPDTAREMLVSAFGEERAGELYKKAIDRNEKPFQFLNEYDSTQILLLLKDESSHVLAVILPYLQPKLASEIIGRLSADQQRDTVRRIAKLDKVDPEVVRKIEEGVLERLRKQGTVEVNEVDGRSALANILKFMDTDTEESILDSLEEDNPELSDSIRDKLFTLDDILKVMDKDMQKALRDFTEKDIALFLKGKSQAFRDKVLKCVSQNRKAIIEDEYDLMGPARREDVDAITKTILQHFKALYDSGKLILESDDDLVD